MPKKQLGAVFITGLIFLIVITLLGITAMKTANLEERMSGNMRDRNRALQAAEMGLRYAEQHIRDNNAIALNTMGANYAEQNSDNPNPNPVVGVTGFDAACTGGYCYYGAGVAAPGNPGANCAPNCPIVYIAGTIFNTDGVGYTAPALPVGLLASPTYVIEGIKKTPAGGGGVRYYYRITVRAQGARLGTVVWLQEIFRP